MQLLYRSAFAIDAFAVAIMALRILIVPNANLSPGRGFAVKVVLVLGGWLVYCRSLYQDGQVGRAAALASVPAVPIALFPGVILLYFFGSGRKW